MAALPDLITVERFRQLPDNVEFACELHHGELVRMTRPKAAHWDLQLRLTDLLRAELRGFVIGMEFPFRAVPEFDLRAADVAAVTRERYAAIDPEDNLHGAPDLVIEVKSPSNTPRKLQELASLCLANGAIEFWIVDRSLKSITVVQRDGSRETYGVDAGISLAAFGGASLAVRRFSTSLDALRSKNPNQSLCYQLARSADSCTTQLSRLGVRSSFDERRVDGGPEPDTF